MLGLKKSSSLMGVKGSRLSLGPRSLKLKALRRLLFEVLMENWPVKGEECGWSEDNLGFFACCLFC